MQQVAGFAVDSNGHQRMSEIESETIREKVSSQEAKQKLADIVYKKQGIKGTELVAIFTSQYDCNESAILLLDEMVRQRTIEEVEYCLPNTSTAMKSMFFPQGTRFI